MDKDAIYAEFLKNFPQFKPQVKVYYSAGDRAIKIYTKQNKKFIFELENDGDFSLRRQ